MTVLTIWTAYNDSAISVRQINLLGNLAQLRRHIGGGIAESKDHDTFSRQRLGSTANRQS